MSTSDQQAGQLGSQVSVSPSVVDVGPGGVIDLNESIIRLLHDSLQIQRQQLELTREMVVTAREARQRQQADLQAWQRSNEGVVERCRDVLETLSQIHAGMLGDMADHINENVENLLESDFAISEFVDRFGPRLHHLSAMLSVFKQLSAQPSDSQRKVKARRNST